MRKPSELKLFVDKEIKETSKLYIEAENNIDDNVSFAEELELQVLKAKLELLFKIQKICENRKRY